MTGNGDIAIRSLTPDDADGCDAVVASLPYHFGNERGIEACATAVRREEGAIATIDGEVAGFLTFVHHVPESAEITWMAVHADHRREGIGRSLIEHTTSTLSARGTRFVYVLTLGPSVPEDVEDGYEGTRMFYRAVGFIPLGELDLRSWDDERALLLVRSLEADTTAGGRLSGPAARS
jgi:ribosomal protein S18 acetylase RimI-like enzyme